MKYIYRIFIVLTIIILSLVVLIAYRIKPQYENKGVNRLKSDKTGQTEIFDDKNLINVFESNKELRILLLGVDKSKTKDKYDDGKNMRTDTIMLFTIFPEDKKVQIVSIPRDSYVTIHGYGKHKVNSAFNPKVYPNGGLDLTVKTVEDFLDIDIDHYAIVDYKAVIEIVDALGGVDVYWDHPDYSYVDDWVIPPLKIDLKEGNNHLDGINAVSYLRARKGLEDQDIGRIQNQQNFLMLLFDKVKQPSTIFKIPELLDIVDKYIETDFSYGELAYLAKFGLSLEKSDISTYTLEGKRRTGVNLGGYEVEVYELDMDKAKEIVKSY
jgi:LCP family protein required for cell wall assembly